MRLTTETRWQPEEPWQANKDKKQEQGAHPIGTKREGSDQPWCWFKKVKEKIPLQNAMRTKCMIIAVEPILIQCYFLTFRIE